MSCGVYVWIGVRSTRLPLDDDYCVPETIAHTKEICVSRITEPGVVPMRKLLILRGRMTD